MPKSARSRGGPASAEIQANIERLRRMLDRGNLLRSQRDVIEELLTKEEAKLAEATRQAEQDC